MLGSKLAIESRPCLVRRNLKLLSENPGGKQIDYRILINANLERFGRKSTSPLCHALHHELRKMDVNDQQTNSRKSKLARTFGMIL